jgi:hypothetical protein
MLAQNCHCLLQNSFPERIKFFSKLLQKELEVVIVPSAVHIVTAVGLNLEPTVGLWQYN